VVEVAMSATVLVLEDDSAIRRTVLRAFHREGWETVAAASCSEALAVSRAVDAAVLDVRLPDGDGLSVARAIKGRLTDVVVFYSGSFETECESLGDFVSKLDGVKALVERVRSRLPCRATKS
jgi:DNA-binding response OmpR family regulator